MQQCQMKVEGEPCPQPAAVKKNILCSPEDEGVADWWIFQCQEHRSLDLASGQGHYVAATEELA